MKIWKLSSLDLDFTGWRYSEHKGDAIVRAKDEKEAREIATLSLTRFTKRVPCQDTPRSPWDDSTVVQCDEWGDSKYSTDGQAKLLEPEIEDIDI